MEHANGRATPALAEDLIRRGEGCAEAGQLSQAATLLVRAWTIAAGDADDHETTNGHASALRNTAAWDVAWVYVHSGAYQEAATWLRRISAPPPVACLWTIDRPDLVQIGAQRPAAPRRAVREAEPTGPARAPAARPVIEVFSLGRFQILRDGRVLAPCPSLKAVTIFRYLLTRRERAASRDELTDLLWPESAPGEAAHRLHVAVSTLRHYLDPAMSGLLLYRDATYQIDPQAFLVDDCTRFRELSSEGDRARRRGDLLAARMIYEDALGYYQGDFHVSSHDLAWHVGERERLLSSYLAVLDHLGAAYIAERRFEPALECYQQLLVRDAFREDAHVQVMRCYGRLGRRSEALRQFVRCAGLLATELGVEPLPETRAVYELLRSGEPLL